MRAALSARRVALHLLDRILAGASLDDADANGTLDRLNAPDRAFVHALLRATLRAKGYLDAALRRCLTDPKAGLPAPVTTILELGAAQLLLLGIPDHAAVAETVALVDGPASRFKGLANAVLRRLARDRAAALGLDRARLSTPDWLWESWADSYGPAVAQAIAAAHQVEPPLDLSVRGDPDTLAGPLGATLLPGGSLRLTQAGRIESLPLYDQGAWWVQDAAAALPARLLAPPPGAPVLDLCAAPGGKTAQLAAMGARVTALDQAAGRLDRLGRNLARLGLEAQTVRADAATWRPDHPFPFVLLDAPCSATGTLRRNPDVALHRQPRDIATLADVQARLLRAAGAMTAPGGTLVYCTCSLQPAEGEAQAAAFLADTPSFVPAPIAPGEVPDLAQALTPQGALRTLPSHWPERGGLDGFYVARFRRSG